MPKAYTRFFDSMESFLETCNQEPKYTPNGEPYRYGTYDSWCGGSWELANKLVREGWEEGVTAMEKFVSLFESKLGSQLKIDDYFYDVSGQDFDLDRVLIGEPEAWLNSEPITVNAPALHVLKLVVNINVSAGVDQTKIIRRGAAIAALVSLLERSQRSVEVVLASHSMNRDNKDTFTGQLVLKHAGQQMDLNKLAFALAHPTMFRHLWFGMWEVCWPSLPCGYGKILDIEEKGDIYTPAMMFGGPFDTDSSTEQWILDELQKQGVELKGEGA